MTPPHPALVGLVAGALARLANEQPIVSEVGQGDLKAGTIRMTFNGDERYVVRIERA